MMDASSLSASWRPWLASRGARGRFLLAPIRAGLLRNQAHREIRVEGNCHPRQQGKQLTLGTAGLAGSSTAYLGPGKMCGRCSCLIKRDIRNRRYLGHRVAELNEDGFHESLLSDSAALKCSVERMGFGLSGCATWSKLLNLSGL